MNTTIPSETNLEDILQQLQDELSDGNICVDHFLQAHQRMRQYNLRLQELIQWAIEQHREEKKLQDLYRHVAGWNASELIKELNKAGYNIKRNQNIKGAFDRQGYRILELIRAGKRDQVFHAILRMYVSFQRPFPEVLLEPFKPHYSDELFKVFLFSFLSSILGKDEQQHEQNQSGRANEEQANED